jgi:hypothetical protein
LLLRRYIVLVEAASEVKFELPFEYPCGGKGWFEVVLLPEGASKSVRWLDIGDAAFESIGEGAGPSGAAIRLELDSPSQIVCMPWRAKLKPSTCESGRDRRRVESVLHDERLFEFSLLSTHDQPTTKVQIGYYYLQFALDDIHLSYA